MNPDPSLRAVSLFSNCGAGDLGYKGAGFTFTTLAELDPRRLEVALLNHPGAVGVPGDLRETWPLVVSAYQQEVQADERPALLAACPPCQGMSSARSGRGAEADADAGSRDSRNLLVSIIIEVARALQPRAIVVENVPAFLRRQVRHPVTRNPVSAAALLVDELARDYRTYPLSEDLAVFGIPQTRKRCFLTLIHRDEPGIEWLSARNKTPYPRVTHGEGRDNALVTIEQALNGMQRLDASTPSTAADPSDPMHAVPIWDERRYRMVEAVAPGSSAWQNGLCDKCGADEHDANAAVCKTCDAILLRPVVVPEEGEPRLIRGFRTSSYTRMRGDRPSATITTASGHMGSDRTLHPSQNRVLSPRECATLQTLPADFRWGDALAKWGHSNVREMIGEAVPPAFTHLHGQAIARVLTGRGPAGLMTAAETGVQRADRALRRAVGDLVKLVG